MTYLTRPVFEFAVDWGNPINQAHEYTLWELSLGFGEEVFNPLQTHVVRTWEITTLLPSCSAIETFEAFFDALNGRLQGFWLPVPLAACKWRAAVDTTHFDIESQGLADTWSDHPSIYLWIGTATPQIRRITAVAAITGGERITLDSALATQPTANTPIRRLVYVRLANDEESTEYLAEGVQFRGIKAVELPLEYTSYELGTQPIYLYRFWMDAPAHTEWRYTSFAADVASNDQLFSASALTHGALKDSGEAKDNTLTIEAAYTSGHPLSLFLPLAPQRPLRVEVSQASYAAPDTAAVIFTGTVRKVGDDGHKLSAECNSWWGILQRKAPRLFLQRTCNHDLFEPNTCRVMRAGFEATAQIVSLAPDAYPPTVVVDLIYTTFNQMLDWVTEDWFAGGFLEIGSGTSFECRTITRSVLSASTNRLTLQLNAPLLHAAAEDWVQLLAGCDGESATCAAKFNNLVNFGGFGDIPSRNPSLKAMNTPTSQGGKK
jgi:uncharacterized phage protein (TIGR02218 family)